MEESPEAYVDRVFTYCMKATKTVTLQDEEMKPKAIVTEAPKEAAPDPIDVAFDNFAKPVQSAKNQSVNQYLADLEKDFAKGE